jgi:alpha-beta hydrolase superfamily lysophospholipase
MSHLFTTEHCPLLYGADAPPVPDNLPAGQHGEFIRSSDNRLWLFQRQWIPSSETIIATLMILHGTVDHGGVYHELALALNEVGIALFCTDMRGFGLSDGEAYYVHDMSTFVSDVEAQYARIHEKFSNVKYRFLLGKSIGGLLAAYACCSPNVHFDGLIGLSGAFALGETMIPPGPVMGLLYSLYLIMPKLPLKSLMESSLLVSDDMAAKAWELDPLVRRGRLTVGYLYELLRCSQALDNKMKDAFPSEMPMLMLWGEDDAIVTRAGHEQMCTFSKNATFKTYPEGRHNLLMEPTLKMQVIQDIRDWILVNCKSN